MTYPGYAVLIMAACALVVPPAEARLGGGERGLSGSGFHPQGGERQFQNRQVPQGGARYHGGASRPQGVPPRGEAQRAARPVQRPATNQAMQTRAGTPYAARQTTSQRSAIQGGRQVTVNTGNTVVAGRGGVPAGGGGYRAPMPYPVYSGSSSGWDAGSVIAGGLVAGATAGLVAGAISNANSPSTVIMEAPAASAYPAPVYAAPVYAAPPSTASGTASTAAAEQARQSANAAQNAASEAQRAAGQAQGAAASANQAASQPAPPPAPPAPPTPPGARYALGTRFAQLPEGCVPETIGPIGFDHCGNDWLQPVMEGGTVTWIAVPPPRG